MTVQELLSNFALKRRIEGVYELKGLWRFSDLRELFPDVEVKPGPQAIGFTFKLEDGNVIVGAAPNPNGTVELVSALVLPPGDDIDEAFKAFLAGDDE